MGVCGSAISTQDHATKERERRINKIITTSQDKDKETEVEVLKLLLLGTGESGKSTLFKQVIQLYGKGFSDDARAPYASIVYANTIACMKTLILQSEKLSSTYETSYSADLKEAAKYVNELKLEDEVDQVTATYIKKLWSDPGIQKTYTKRSMFQLTDACQWFFDRLDAIGQENYLPSYDDILRCRARTTGIVETSFTLEGNKFRMLDVGGQRNERKKWFHCFEAVTAVIFVAAINEYDQVLYEDGKTNRIHESLTLFGEICNSRWFHKTSMILFLNKNDLFKTKIETVDMKCCFENYEGGCNYDEAALFLTEQFMAKNDYPHKKKIYVHITCATNTKNIAFTFNVVKDIIVKNGLKECGLLV